MGTWEQVSRRFYIYVVSHISYIDADEMSLEYQWLNLLYSIGGIVNKTGKGLMIGVLVSGSNGALARVFEMWF